MIRGYRDLEVWQMAMDQAVESYRLSARFPRSEVYGLTLQLRKSAGSVPANIAEGRGRRTTKEFLRFLDIAYGSLVETETHLELALRLGYLEDDEVRSFSDRSARIGRMINGLRTSLEKKHGT